MRCLIVHAHPDPGSYNAAICATVRAALAARGAELRVIDLYAEGFDPVLCRDRWRAYPDRARNLDGLEAHAEALRWADSLVFIYPTWWFGPPAMLKGWLERVWTPGLAFDLRPERPLEGRLRHIERLGVVTTCGASWLVTQMVGAPGRNTLLRGCGGLMARRCKRLFLAHYRMDDSTPQSRARFLMRVETAFARF